jgi:hypothetical protein
MFILVQDAVETITSADIEAGKPARFGDGFGQRLEWSGVGDALVRPVGVVERFVFV